jgi:hypothetical protein
MLWVDLHPPAARERAEAGQRPVLTETAEAEARDHPLAEAGQRLSLDGDSWRVIRVTRGAPKLGRMILFLEKDLS